MQGCLILLESVIEIGVLSPFSFLHVTDSHIDMDSCEGNGAYYLEKAQCFAKEKNVFLLCTGDIFKCYSPKNIDYAKNHINTDSGIYIPGNHDFCSFDNDGLGEAERETEFSKKWHGFYKKDLCFDARIINGVNFISIQNIYYSISKRQIQMLKEEVARGYPIILCVHIPLFSSEKAEEMLAGGNPCAYMLAPPKEYLKRYYPPSVKAQTPTKQTLESLEYIKNEPLIKAVVAGHIHQNFDGYADCGKRQITTGKLSDGIARLIKVV
ncbi:MAG: metallophosphoesterase [Clostridia bacterium]|nr:metallophosphoesterase [Clostridia bacterium]